MIAYTVKLRMAYLLEECSKVLEDLLEEEESIRAGQGGTKQSEWGAERRVNGA